MKPVVYVELANTNILGRAKDVITLLYDIPNNLGAFINHADQIENNANIQEIIDEIWGDVAAMTSLYKYKTMSFTFVDETNTCIATITFKKINAKKQTYKQKYFVDWAAAGVEMKYLDGEDEV